MRLVEIADSLSCTLEGDGSIDVTGVATLESARDGDISFLSNPKYYQEAKRTKASAIIVDFACPKLNVPLIRHRNPYLVFAKVIEIFYPQKSNPPLIHPTAWICDTAIVNQGVSVGAFSYIGEKVVLGSGVIIKENCTIHHGVTIGEDSIIHSGCVIREDARIGKRCIIQDNAVIGSDGFGYAKQDDGSWYKIIQAGGVVIEDDVEIGAGTTIDRSTLGETRICSGTKIDNLVQIGHACEIGSNSLICAQVGLAGSTKTGKGVILAGQVGSAGHLVLGDGVIATGQTGIPGSVDAGKVISGSPAIDNKRWLKATAIFSKLPEIQKSIRELELRVNKLDGGDDLENKPNNK